MVYMLLFSFILVENSTIFLVFWGMLIYEKIIKKWLSFVAKDDCLVFALRPILNRFSCGQSDPLRICSNTDDCCIGNCLKYWLNVVGHVHADILAGAAMIRI